MASNLPLAETVGMALNTLKANRLRSLLTMLGIVIGNASVITLVGVGRGAQNLAENQLSNLGANVLFVVPGSNDTRRQGVAFPRTLVLEDAEAIAEQVPSVKRVAPQINANEVVQAGARSSTSAIFGVTPEFLPVRSFEVARGRFITAQDLQAARTVVVIGPDRPRQTVPEWRSHWQFAAHSRSEFQCGGCASSQRSCLRIQSRRKCLYPAQHNGQPTDGSRPDLWHQSQFHQC